MTERLSDKDVDLALARARQFVADHVVNAPRFEPSYFVVTRALLQLSEDLASAKAELAASQTAFKDATADLCRKVDELDKARHYMAMAAAGVEATIRERDQAKDALRKISDIRDSIIGGQKINWSEHIYPLVAVLDAAGFPGAGYDIARENLGTLLEQIAAANDKLRAVRAVLHRAEHDALHTKWTSQGIALALREALGMGSEEGA